GLRQRRDRGKRLRSRTGERRNLLVDHDARAKTERNRKGTVEGIAIVATGPADTLNASEATNDEPLVSPANSAQITVPDRGREGSGMKIGSPPRYWRSGTR